MLAHRITVLEQLLRDVGAEHDHLVPVVDVREIDEHTAREIEVPGRQVLRCHADHLRGGVLSPGGQPRRGTDLRCRCKHRGCIYRVDQRVGVAKRELSVSGRLHEQ